MWFSFIIFQLIRLNLWSSVRSLSRNFSYIPVYVSMILLVCDFFFLVLVDDFLSFGWWMPVEDKRPKLSLIVYYLLFDGVREQNNWIESKSVNQKKIVPYILIKGKMCDEHFITSLNNWLIHNNNNHNRKNKQINNNTQMVKNWHHQCALKFNRKCVDNSKLIDLWKFINFFVFNSVDFRFLVFISMLFSLSCNFFFKLIYWAVIRCVFACFWSCSARVQIIQFVKSEFCKHHMKSMIRNELSTICLTFACWFSIVPY